MYAIVFHQWDRWVIIAKGLKADNGGSVVKFWVVDLVPMNQWLEIVKTTYFRQSFLLLLKVLSMAVQDNPEKERATVSLHV